MRVALGSLIVCAAVAVAGTNQWTNIGPEGGFVWSVIIDPQTPGTLYAATGAGVFKSSDQGASWGEAGSIGLGVYRLVIDPANPGTLYALSGGGQLLKSTDAAVTWRATGFSCSCLDLAIDPLSSRLYLASSEGVVYNSEDAGQTWNEVKVAEGFRAASLGVDQRDSGVLYVAAVLAGGSAYRPVIFKSTNGGVLWNESDLPYTPGAGAFKSTDAGASWTPINAGLRATPVTLVVFDPQSPSTIYAGTDLLGVFKSTDRGNSWHAADSGSTFAWFTCGVAALAVDPQTPDNLYLGTGPGSIGDYCGTLNGGVFKSSDGAESWSDTRGPSCLSALSIDPLKPSTIYAGSCYMGVVKSVDGGRRWTQIGDGLPRNPNGAWVSALTIDPINPDNLYAGVVEVGVRGSWHVFKSADGGYTWSATSLMTPAPDPWALTALTIDPLNTNTLYAAVLDSASGTGGFWKSSDGGASWQSLRDRGDIAAVIVDSRQPGIVFASASDGILRSTDGGENWAAAPGSSGFRLLALDPENSDTLYAAGGGSLFTMTLVPNNRESNCGAKGSSTHASSQRKRATY